MPRWRIRKGPHRCGALQNSETKSPHRDQQTPERAAVPLVKFQPGWLPHHVVPALAYNTRLTPDDVAFRSMLLKKDFKGDAEQY